MAAPTIFLVNRSTNVTDDQVKRIAAACDSQIIHHAALPWERLPYRVGWVATGQPIPTIGYNILILDTLDEANAAGWHTDDAQGIHGVVGTKVWLDHGGSVLRGPMSVATTCSHEVLELFLDKNANEWRDSGRGWSIIQEVCDPVEGDFYDINGVSVSNFVTPNYFDPTPPSGHIKYDYLGKLTEPFSLDKGGYFVYYQNGQEQQYFAAQVPQWMRDLKQHPATRNQKIMSAQPR